MIIISIWLYQEDCDSQDGFTDRFGIMIMWGEVLLSLETAYFLGEKQEKWQLAIW